MLAPDLGVCVVGSSALATACERAGINGPETADLDLAWDLDVDAGTELLQRHDVWSKTTDANRRRGTLAMRLDGRRVEITSFRTAANEPRSATLGARIERDLAGRDMTLGALAHWLTANRILDPFGGLDDWREKRIVAVGDPGDRIREHPIRWIRYFRRAHQWGFALDPRIPHVDVYAGILAAEPAEAIGSELRAALLQCASPGTFLHELHECGILAAIAPELAPQFDGRAAGPVRHHPEGSQAAHLKLALEWIAARSAELDERDRLAVTVAVLCHDLGKGLTPEHELPAHRGHEESGLAPLRSFLERYPGLTDPAGKRLATAVCALHLKIRRLAELRPGTRAGLYRRYFHDKNFRVDLFALAVGADSGGRLGRAKDGEVVARAVRRDIEWMQERCATVDAATLFEENADDKDRFKRLLHEAYADALRGRPPGDDGCGRLTSAADP